MEFFEYPLIFTAVVLMITWLFVKIWNSNRNVPPGPWGLPYFGYYPFLSTKLYLDLANLAKTYGDVLSLRTIGGKLFIVVSGPKLIKDILVNRSAEFIGRPIESNLLEWISDGLGVTQEEGAPWKEHRRFFLQTVKNFGFGKIEIESTIHEELKTLKEDLMKANGKPTDFNFHVAYVANSVIAQVMFARKFDKNGDIFPKLAKGVHELIDIFADQRFLLVGPFYRYIAMHLLPWSAKVRRGRAVLKKVVEEIIDEHVRTFDPNHLRDYVDSYLLQRHTLKESNSLEASTFTMERLLGISMNMTMEGTESVQSAIVCLLCGASRHLEEQKKVQAELDAVVGRERLPSCLDKQKLPYLEAFIQELHRTAMAFYITTHYCNFEETQIKGYRIPKRSILVGNLWTINNDPELFPDPSKFNPRRFLDQNGERMKTDGPYPFSMGKRDCVGQALAQMEVFLIISSVLQSFTLYPTAKEGVLRAIPRPTT